MRARNTGTIFKHLKHLKKSPSLPKLLIKENQQSTKMQEQVNMMNEFFHSVFSPKVPFSIQDVKLRNPEITNFEISKKAIYEILLSLDATNSRSPNGILPAFFHRTARETSMNLNVLFKQIKRQRKIPNSWKIAAVTPIYKKDDRRKVENYRPVSLLDIGSKFFEKCICSALYAHFEKFQTEHKHGFVKKRSNMQSFLKTIHDALNNESSTEIVALYTDFSKAFDKVPHFELVEKVANIGVGGCLLEIIIDYLDNRKQFVRVDNTRSETLDVTSRVPQGSLLGPLLFCTFINDLPDVLVFSDPFIFADDLKILAVKKTFWQVQNHLNGIEQWVNENEMKLAMDKCAKLSIRGQTQITSLWALN